MCGLSVYIGSKTFKTFWSCTPVHPIETRVVSTNGSCGKVVAGIFRCRLVLLVALVVACSMECHCGP